MDTELHKYKIRQVIELTGASEFLLRIWENRYSAFTPDRTKTGRRLYSENDVLKARALLILTQNGFRIGQLAQLPLAQLNKYTQLTNDDVEPIHEIVLYPKLKKLMLHAHQFEWDYVRNLILREKEKYEVITWIHNFITPLVQEMVRQVENKQFSIAQEHILSALIKESLCSSVTLPKKMQKRATRIIFAAPEGDHHDMGLTIACRIAIELNASTLFLGAHMPRRELSDTCLRFKASHLVLTSTTTKENGAKDNYLSYLNFLDRNLDPKITLWLAGKNVQENPIVLKRKFQILDSFHTFEHEVKKCLK